MVDAFMGVQSDALTALGKVVVAAGRVELVLALVANEVGVLDPTGSASRVVKDLKRAVRGDIPDPLLALQPEVLAWVSTLPALFEFRNRAIHGVRMKSMSADGEVTPIALLMRSGDQMVDDVHELGSAAERLAKLYTDGMNLFGSLHIANLSLRQHRPQL